MRGIGPVDHPDIEERFAAVQVERIDAIPIRAAALQRQLDAVQILLDLRLPRLVLDLDEVRQRDRHQDADDHHDHQQLNQSKAETNSPHQSLLKVNDERELYHDIDNALAIRKKLQIALTFQGQGHRTAGLLPVSYNGTDTCQREEA